MSHRHPRPTRSLPSRPNLAQLRKQAKELLKAFMAGDPAAVDEIGKFEANVDPLSFSLADAQRVLARAYGYTSWSKLKKLIDGRNVTAFCDAVDAGDVTTVCRLAKDRPELVNTARGGRFSERTALHFAVLNCDADMTRALMSRGADARRGFWPHREATSAHTIAVDRGYDEIVDIIERAEERSRREQSSPGSTISPKTDSILEAIQKRQCEQAIQLLESDLSLIGACNGYGVTPLHIAASTHNPDMVGWLLDHHASVDAKAFYDVPPYLHQTRGGSGHSPLDYAAIVAGWNAHGRDFRFLENTFIDPSHFHETVRLLRFYGAALTPRAAVATGDKQAIIQMQRKNKFHNDIHFFRGGLLSIAVRVDRVEMVSLLLDMGLDPDESAVPAEDGARSWGMPLWFAVICERNEIGELLLSRGADVNAVVHACGDAMCNALMTQNNAMQSMLQEHGARITVEHIASSGDRTRARAILDGTIPGHCLDVQNPSSTRLAEQLLLAACSCDVEIVRMCLAHIKRESTDPWWNYVLVRASLPESFNAVLEHGIDPNVVGDEGYTALHHIATDYVNGSKNRLAFATGLLNAGASLDRRDSLLMSTPLGWACRWGRIELVRLYLDRGADPVESDAETWATPMHWAERGEHREIVQLLKSRGAKPA